jgi:hypothetical protein
MAAYCKTFFADRKAEAEYKPSIHDLLSFGFLEL